MVNVGLSLVIGATLLGLGPQPASGAARTDPGASTVSSDRVSDALRVRSELGFDTALSTVLDVLTTTEVGIPLTKGELAEVADRARIADELAPVTQFINDHPKEFGGAFYDQSVGYMLLVVRTLTSTPDESLKAIAGMTPADAQVEFRPASYSTFELEALRNEVFFNLPTDAAKTAFVDPKTNRLVVTVGAGGLVRANDLIGDRSDRISLSVGGPVVGDGCTSRTACTAPWRGGTYLSGCTWGFNARPQNTTSATRYVISAGHCSHIGDDRIHNGTIVNTSIGVDRNTFDLPASTAVDSDSMRAPLKADNTGARNLILRGGTALAYSITSYELTSQQTVGEGILMAGAGVSPLVGTIQAKDLMATVSRGTDSRDIFLNRATFNTIGGDSGGPVISSSAGRAFGIVQGHAVGDNRMMYSAISSVMRDMVVRLCLNSTCS